jgi:hypothetical protein
VELIEVYPFQLRSPNAVNFFYIGFDTLAGRSLYDFYTSDDGTGSVNNSDIQVVSTSIAEDNGKDILFAVWENTSSTTPYYLKSVTVRGYGVLTTARIKTEQVNQLALAEDGSETVYTLESKAIQSDTQLNLLASLLSLNLSNYADVYALEIAGRPTAKLGTVLAFKDRSNTTITGTIFEIDGEVSGSNGFLQTAIIKKLPDPVNYFAWDTTGIGWDDSDYQFL